MQDEHKLKFGNFLTIPHTWAMIAQPVK
jgi:hypothetical protein